MEDLASESSCKIENLLTVDLGLPLGARYNLVSVWDEVYPRKRLAVWKRQFLSKGGRLTLTGTTLSNILTYGMSLLQLPKRIKSTLAKIQKDFL